MATFDVIISGAGPAGLLLAIDLGQRGVKTLLVEKNEAPGPWPKMERTNPRSMEILRRMGLASLVRKAGYPEEASMDIFVGTTLSDPALAHLKFPTVKEFRERISKTNDGSQPLEPYQLVSQYDLEPVLKTAAESTPNLSVRFGVELGSFEQDNAGVKVKLLAANGTEEELDSHYLVGCDGGGSPIRKALGIALQGEGRIRSLTQVQFRSKELYDKAQIGQGRHYLLFNGNTIVTQGNRKDFTLHTMLDGESDFETAIRDSIGSDIEFEILRKNSWNHNLLVAERFRKDRVFLVGDAAHLVIPNGGLGMNTAVGDAATLSWQLAGTINGWGGPQLLDAYEAERRPVALFNMEASRWATNQLEEWKKYLTPELLKENEEVSRRRVELGKQAYQPTLNSYTMLGAELGYIYAESPIIVAEETELKTWQIQHYVPTATPGARLPHMWLSDGQAIQDLLGKDFTLISLRGERVPQDFIDLFIQHQIPLKTLVLDEPLLGEVYGSNFLLIRPDLHVVWRGNSSPADVAKIVSTATGR